MSVSANVIGKRSGLADAASTPRQTAATATAATAATSATPAAAAPATATAATAAPATAATCFLHAALGSRSVFLVEHIERREADVGDFFFAERELVTQSEGRRIRRVGRRRDCCGCASH